MMDSAEFKALRMLSARLGADPLLVQAAGGNTSLKQDGVMWIKASGTWLRDAQAKAIFVPLDQAKLSRALAANDPDCESCLPFVRQDLNATGLRPSIETSVHGLMPQAVVLHVHCVNTIAFAIQQEAKSKLAQRLMAFKWAFVPYARPGLQLSQAIQSVLQPDTEVLVLQNHGLAVAAPTVAEAEDLLNRVVAALVIIPRKFACPDVAVLQATAANTNYVPASDPHAHAIAMDEWAYELGGSEVYYPDHVVFLGTSVPRDMASGAAAVTVPGAGVLVRKDAKPAVEPMLRCLGDVFQRLDHGAALKALTAQEIDMLLNWDAEKYRQTLKQP